jgi:DNA polymerase kappa
MHSLSQQFFESASTSRPIKRQKVEHADADGIDLSNDKGGEVDSMLEFFGHMEEKYSLHDDPEDPLHGSEGHAAGVPSSLLDGNNETIQPCFSTTSSHRPFVINTSTPPSHKAAPGTSIDRGFPVSEQLEEHTCPICGKVMQVTNQSLNDHIDYCLSRSVIRQAQAEASSHGQQEKPRSRGKNKK